MIILNFKIILLSAIIVDAKHGEKDDEHDKTSANSNGTSMTDQSYRTAVFIQLSKDAYSDIMNRNNKMKLLNSIEKDDKTNKQLIDGETSTKFCPRMTQMHLMKCRDKLLLIKKFLIKCQNFEQTNKLKERVNKLTAKLNTCNNDFKLLEEERAKAIKKLNKIEIALKSLQRRVDFLEMTNNRLTQGNRRARIVNHKLTQAVGDPEGRLAQRIRSRHKSFKQGCPRNETFGSNRQENDKENIYTDNEAFVQQFQIHTTSGANNLFISQKPRTVSYRIKSHTSRKTKRNGQKSRLSLNNMSF